MELTELTPVLTSLATFAGGGLIGALITMISDGRLNRNAIDAQLKAEQREVVAQILLRFQRATNALGMLRLEKSEDLEDIGRVLGGFMRSATEALDLLPRLELTVRDPAVRQSLINFLTKLGLILHDHVPPVLGVYPPEEHSELQRRIRFLKGQGKELYEYYEEALDAARKNLQTESRQLRKWPARRRRKTDKIPTLRETDKWNTDRLRESTFRRFDPDFSA